MFSAPGLPRHDPSAEQIVIPMAKSIIGFTNEDIAIAWLRTEFPREQVAQYGRLAFEREKIRQSILNAKGE